MVLTSRDRPFNWFNGAFVNNRYIPQMKIQKIEVLTEIELEKKRNDKGNKC
ncbi:MAG: hypothetical protein LBT02_02280 [Rickettsiales bacterium]|nr:hypothetical protein [Rickettsiales bacterium]